MTRSWDIINPDDHPEEDKFRCALHKMEKNILNKPRLATFNANGHIITDVVVSVEWFECHYVFYTANGPDTLTGFGWFVQREFIKWL